MAGHNDNLKLFENYFGQRGFRFEGVEARTFQSSPEKLKTYLKHRYAQDGLQHVVLPPNAFRRPMQVNWRGKDLQIVSDKFYTNLDDDSSMLDEITLARCSITDFARIVQRNYSDTLAIDVAFPILNYSRRGCGDVPIPPTRDASHFGYQLKKLANEAHYTLNTYFEQEGSRRSAREADFPLNLQLLRQSSANVKFYLSTFEELIYSNGWYLIEAHPAFYHAIFHDHDQDHFVDQDEVQVHPFFSFDDQWVKVHQIGILSLFDNALMNLNAFSAIVGFEFPKGVYLEAGDQSGTTGSYLAVLGLVFENLLSGKTIGESIDVYHQYLQRFTNDNSQQEIVALTLFVRGDPTLRLHDLVAAPRVTVHPKDEISFSGFQCWASFELHNSGNRDLNWKLTHIPEWIKVSGITGTVPAGGSQKVYLYDRSWLFKSQAQGSLSIQCNDPQQEVVTLQITKQAFRKK
jgi:hypothetical protein